MINNSEKPDIAEKKTALVLGGGGSRGAYEAGVWQALTDLGIVIDMVFGTSVGAINAAMVAQGDLELTKNMWKQLETEEVFDVPEGFQPKDYLKEIVLNRGAGTERLKEKLKLYLKENKIRESGIEFGITCVSLPLLKPHYMYIEDIPEGQLADFIIASSSAFPFIHSHEIDGVEYIDGGYADPLPVLMAIEKGATHIIAVDLKGYGSIKKDELEKAPNLTYISSRSDLGFQFTFDIENSKRNMKLGYFDCLKAYGVLDGDYLSFAKGCFDKTSMKMADSLGAIIGLNPCRIYTKDIFFEEVGEKIRADKAKLSDIKKIPTLRTFIEIKDHFTKKLFHDGEAEIGAQKLLMYAAALDLKKNADKSIFLTRPVMKFIPEIVSAARFLNKFGMPE